MVICVLVAGLFLLSRTEQSRQYAKELIEQRLNSIPNFHISLGNVRGSLISTVEIENIEVKIAGEKFAEIERLSTNYSIPLLYSIFSRQKLHLSNTQIQGLNLLIEKDSLGVWNFKKLRNNEKDTRGSQQKKVSLILTNNRISDSRVSIVDNTKDKTWEFDLIEESLFSVNIVELTKRVELDAKDINFDYVSPRIRIRNLRGKIDIASWNCVFEKTGFKVENVPLRGSGTVRNLRKPEFDMDVYFESPGTSAEKKINLQAKTKIKMHSVDNMVGTVEVSTYDSFLNGKKIWADLEPLTINGTEALIKGKVGGGFGESRLEGRIDFRKWLAGEKKNLFDLTAELKGTDTDELIAILNRTPYLLKFGNDSSLSSRLRISGDWMNREIYSLHIEPDYLNLTDGKQSTLDLGGYLVLGDKSVDFNISSEAKEFKLELQFPKMAIKNHVDGSATLQGQIPRKGNLFEDWYLSLKADLKTDSLYGMTDIISRIDGSIQNGSLTVNTLDILSDQFSLFAERTRGTEKGLDCIFEFKTHDLGFLSDIDERIPLILGKINSKGTISGEIFTPLIKANSHLENFSYEDFTAQKMSVLSSTQIDFKKTPNLLLEIDIQGQQARVFGNSADTVEAKLRGTESNMEVNALVRKETGSFASSEFSVEGLLDHEKKLRFSYLEGLLEERSFKSTGDIFLDISTDRMAVWGDEFLYGDGKISNFLGEIDRKENTVRLRANMTKFNPLFISKILNFRYDLEGTLDGRIEASGPLGTPSVQAEIKSDGLSYGFPSSSKMETRISGKEGKLFVDLDSSMNDKKILSLRGEIMASKNARNLTEAITGISMDLELTSHGHDLGFVKIFSNSIEKIEGDFSSDLLSLKGTPLNPRIRGNLELNNMDLSLSQLRNNLSVQHAKFSFEGKKLSLPRTEIRSRKGKAYIKGKMDISDFTYHADVEMEKIRFNPHSIKTNLSGNLKIEKKDEFLTVTGETEVTAGRIRLYPNRVKTIKNISFIGSNENFSDEFSLTEQNKTGFYREKTAMDILVDISSGTWIKTKEANFNSRGKLRLEKKPDADLNLQGNIVSSEGYYTVFGKLFSIEDASLNFTGAANNPVLNVEAYYDTGDVEVYVNVTGDLTEPEISLSSNPENEKIDIISYIVFGASSNRLQNRQRDFMGKFATAVAAGGISELLSSEIGLNLLSIQEGERGFEDSTLKVGSYVTRDIFVGYERSPSKISLDHSVEMRNKLNLNWRLNRSFSIESQMGGENPGVDFFYNFDF